MFLMKGNQGDSGPKSSACLADSIVGSVEFSIIDLETTGFRKTDRIIEISVVRMTLDGTVISEFETLVNPGRSASDTTHIHGITDGHLVDAPGFEEIGGDLSDVLQKSVWVAHNASFDLRFLAQEYARVGCEVPAWPSLCTMRLSPVRGGPSRPSLVDCHAHFGRSEARQAHRATGDTATTVDVLLGMLAPIQNQLFRSLGICSDPEWSGSFPDLESNLNRSGKRHVREQVRSESTIGTINHVGPGTPEPCLDLYSGAVENALEDRLLEKHELDGLLVLGTKLGISSEQAISISQSYFEGVASRALADGRIDSVERRDLEKVASILELDAETISRLMDNAKTVEAEAVDLEGKSVCFTGGVEATRGAQPLTRTDLQASASGRGMIVKSGVSKKLDLLVTADPHSMSGKPKKARELGVQIVSIESFIGALGIEVD